MFSSTALLLLIVIALAWTGLGALTLIVLLCKDWKTKQLW